MTIQTSRGRHEYNKRKETIVYKFNLTIKTSLKCFSSISIINIIYFFPLKICMRALYSIYREGQNNNAYSKYNIVHRKNK